MNVGGGGGPSSRGAGPGRYVAPPLAELNIIPLVDVVLVVLIIFMVTMSFDKKQNPAPPSDPVFVLPVQLPRSAAATDAPTQEETMVVGVDRDGRRYVGTDPVTTEVLRERLRGLSDRAAKGTAVRVRIDADRDARYQDVVELIELCQFEGLRNVALHTSNKDE
jgi:biopolymer transport protein ExbD